MGALPILEGGQDRAPQTILVVEDEVLIRLEVCDYLRDCGYQVVEAATADEALAILGSDVRVDLVFSDVQMPGRLDGFGLAHWIRANRPELKVLLTSGLVRTSELAAELCDYGPLMDKPFSRQALLRRLQSLLGSADD